jgi:hypothetical protein
MKQIIVALLLMLPNIAMALPTAKATILVVDEYGMPLEGVNVGLGFSIPKKEGWGSKSSGTRGFTDKDGLFTASGSTEQILRYGAKLSGYYPSRYEFREFTSVSGILGFRKWQPWNPTLKVVLKKIKNPIAMSAYHTDWIEIPKNDEFIGYDLVKHDWVSPYGKGITSDFLFRLDKDIRSNQDYDAYLTLKFLDPLDGIQSALVGKEQGSAYRLAYEAPRRGYLNTLKQHEYSRENQSLPMIYKSGQNYYFRIRSNGDTDNSLYGKIHGNIEFSRFGYSNGAIRFTYYLNPSKDDTNIEFDPKRNLFKKLKDSTRKVIEP